nr:immunoglobulin light chain junction region [Macaca mulatta]MOW36739.1 immunoglobulin light chain junction region [Macaca mulatta]MOW36936.1 immunoglobulin light chain junction region [Macaca mulatta]MOW37369.1 immunoglobulin light chain junction region [Macaca mulatta]MOW37515.1 immunoglobulin light chain junction region [Macaca mulatta]
DYYCHVWDSSSVHWVF